MRYYKRRQAVEAMRYNGHRDVLELYNLLKGTNWTATVLDIINNEEIVYVVNTVDYKEIIHPGCWAVKLGSLVTFMTNDLFDAQYESE